MAVRKRITAAPRGIVQLAVAGVLGNLIVDGVRRVMPRGRGRGLAVQAVAGSIKLGRKIGEATEETWLRVNDLVAEGRVAAGDAPTEDLVASEEGQAATGDDGP